MDEPETLTIMVKTFFGVTCFSVTLKWGDGNSCHFNSFVNVFMNAINTSFTLLCFWIPLGCGLCQFLSPRRRPASHNIPLSCVAEHWQTQFTEGRSEPAPCCGSCLDGTHDSSPSEAEPTAPGEECSHTSIRRQGDKESVLADTKQNHCRSRNAENARPRRQKPVTTAGIAVCWCHLKTLGRANEVERKRRAQRQWTRSLHSGT